MRKFLTLKSTFNIHSYRKHSIQSEVGAHPFKPGFCLFHQMFACCKQAAACFKLGDTHSEGNISLNILVCNINLDDKCCVQLAPSFFEKCAHLLKTGIHLF